MRGMSYEYILSRMALVILFAGLSIGLTIIGVIVAVELRWKKEHGGAI